MADWCKTPEFPMLEKPQEWAKRIVRENALLQSKIEALKGDAS
jgi:hypothetical protein